MFPGDLVIFKPKSIGALTAAKYFSRIEKQTNGLTGIIISVHGNNCSVAFGEKIIVLNKSYLEIIK